MKQKPFENIVRNGENAFSSFSDNVFLGYPKPQKTNLNFWDKFIVSFYLALSKILSFGKELTLS